MTSLWAKSVGEDLSGIEWHAIEENQHFLKLNTFSGLDAWIQLDERTSSG